MKFFFFFFFLSPSSPPSSQTELGHKLTLCSKLCFAIGGAPKEVAASATAFFLQIYLLDIAQVKSLITKIMRIVCGSCEWVNELVSFVFLTPVCPRSALQINAFQASMVLFIGKAWGAVTDPVVGFFITKSRWTKIGRLMPWWAPHLWTSSSLLFLLPSPVFVPFFSSALLHLDVFIGSKVGTEHQIAHKYWQEYYWRRFANHLTSDSEVRISTVECSVAFKTRHLVRILDSI